MRFARSLAFFALAACHAAPARSATSTAALFAWPTPPGWKHETIPFPLEFAPSLPYHGTEEVRFAPHFFDTASDTYFTYSFAWVLDDARDIPPDELAGALREYFAGLAHAVGKEKHASYDASAFGAHVESAGGARSRGVVRAVDPFGDGRPLTLNLDAETSTCGGRRVVMVSLSPHAAGDDAWGALLAQRQTFRCLVP